MFVINKLYNKSYSRYKLGGSGGLCLRRVGLAGLFQKLFILGRSPGVLRTPDRKGFTLIEVLIATFVVGTALVGVFGLVVLSLRVAREGEARIVAVALANERAEMVRNLPYVEVGTLAGVPSGSLLQNETIVRNEASYDVKTDIRYVDDPFDGEAPVDLINTDYKQVRIEVSWNSPNQPKPVLLILLVAPQGLEGGEIAGTLDFQLLNASGGGVGGAVVRLVNSVVDPAVDIVTNTNDQGKVLLPGLSKGTVSYQLSVSKSGYTSEQTYDTTAVFIPDADHTHLSALQGEVTEKTFMIDLVSSLAIRTVDEEQVPIGQISYNIKGTKAIGVDDMENIVYLIDEASQTDSGGEVLYEALVWDTYDFSIDGEATGFDIKETSVLLPLVVNPGESVDVEVVLVEHTPLSLHVTVATPEGVPINNAMLRLQRDGYDEILGTGEPGQVLFSDIPSLGDYDLLVEAPGFQSSQQIETVDGTERVRVELIFE